ncbi:pectate lyase superfamily protein-domain-containing protein [Halenospora varia]|nr:pectate lyase superfamily protein-domain-containing protein [Halenospora varia]
MAATAVAEADAVLSGGLLKQDYNILARFLKGQNLKRGEPVYKHLEKRTGNFWMQDIAFVGKIPFGGADNNIYAVYRDVKDYGAVGDGTTDDTATINKVMSEGNKCGANCGSSFMKGAIVYFPSGTYLISSPILLYYHTQMVGDANNRPVLIAAPSFIRLGQLINQIVDKNGSGGFMSDIAFISGVVSICCGIQQFIARDSLFLNCKTAIYMLWDWDWTWKSIWISGSDYRIKMTGNDLGGSLQILDYSMMGTTVGIYITMPLGGAISAHTLVNIDNLINEKVGGPNSGCLQRSKPQYADLSANRFISARLTTTGLYIITQTIKDHVTKEKQILNFQDVSKLRVIVQVGEKGDAGVVEIQDLMFTNQGLTAGVILIEWNVQ